MSTSTTNHDAIIKAARKAQADAKKAENRAWADYRAAIDALKSALDAVLPEIPWDSKDSEPHWSRHKERDLVLASRVEEQPDAVAKAMAHGIDACLVMDHVAAYAKGRAADRAARDARWALQAALAQKYADAPDYTGPAPWGCIAQAPTGEWLVGKVSTTNDYTWASAAQDGDGRWLIHTCHRRRDLVHDNCRAIPLKRTKPVR